MPIFSETKHRKKSIKRISTPSEPIRGYYKLFHDDKPIKILHNETEEWTDEIPFYYETWRVIMAF